MAFPSFSFEQIESLCMHLREQLIGSQVTGCSPNNLNRFYIAFKSRQPLFFSFEHPFIRFNLSSETVPTNSHHPFHPYLKEAILHSIDILNNDRIVQFTFDRHRLICEFFSKHPNYYLTDLDGKILFSLYPSQQAVYQLPPMPKPRAPNPQRLLSHQEIEALYKHLEFEKEKSQIRANLIGTIKKLVNLQTHLTHSLKDCEQWEAVQHEGDLLKANLGLIKKGMDSITIWDWKTEQNQTIKIDPKNTPKDEMAARFHRAKKLQKGFVPLQKQLDKVLEDIVKAERKLSDLEHVEKVEELPPFRLLKANPLTSKKAMTKALPYHEFESASGLKIWVGKSARANDRLTFQLSNGNDWWLHVNGYAGSHVVIKTGKDKEPDQETLLDAIQLALHYSKARDMGEGEVCVTQKKYVTRLARDKPGKVQVSKHKTRWARLDKERLGALKCH